MVNAAIVTLYTKNYQPLADLTLPGQIEYTKKHGYTLYWKNEGFRVTDLKMLCMEKCIWMKELMLEHTEHDWFFWIGTDCLITNHNVTLESILELVPNPNHHFIVCKDHHGINADVFLIKNSEVGRDYLQHLIDETPINPHRSEQAVMWFDEEIPQYRAITKYLPSAVMNSYPLEFHHEAVAHTHDMGRSFKDCLGGRFGWEAGDFVLQVIGGDLQFKVNAISSKMHLILQ